MGFLDLITQVFGTLFGAFGSFQQQGEEQEAQQLNEENVADVLAQLKDWMGEAETDYGRVGQLGANQAMQNQRAGRREFGDFARKIIGQTKTAGEEDVAGFQKFMDSLLGEQKTKQQIDMNAFNEMASGLLGDRRAAIGKDQEEYASATSGIVQGYDDRLGRARDLVSKRGTQQARDIRQDYQSLGSRIGQSLVSQGLGGTTVGASLAGGVEREQRDSLERLSQDLLVEQLGVEETFGGGALEARERVGLGGFLVGRAGREGLSQLSETLAGEGFDIGAAGRQQGLALAGELGMTLQGVGQQARQRNLGATERVEAGRLTQYERLRNQYNQAQLHGQLMPLHAVGPYQTAIAELQAGQRWAAPTTNPWMNTGQLLMNAFQPPPPEPPEPTFMEQWGGLLGTAAAPLANWGGAAAYTGLGNRMGWF